MSVGSIPEKLLINTVEIIDQATQTWHTVSKVAVQLKRGIIFTGVGEEVVAQSYMYVDLRKSIYDDPSIFDNGNIVVHEGQRYTIKNVRYLQATKKHHLQILLV